MIGNIVVFPSQPQQPPPPHPLCQSLCISDGTQGYKGCYLFVLVFFVFFCHVSLLTFFSAVVFLFVHWDVGGPFYFLFFLTSILSLFVLFFFLHAFFLLRSMGENWSKKNRLKRHRVHLTLRVCSRVDDVIVVLV